MISCAFAGPISSADALSLAKDFLTDRGIDTSSIHNAISGTRADTYPTSAAYSEDYYLFNIGESEGFIIVASDGRPSPILGYSTEGSISRENMPKACVEWLDANVSSVSIDNYNSKAISYPDFKVGPLLKSSWDQKDPYNRHCPIDKTSGKHTATGCVATAAAQVMHYYKYPAQAVGKVEYEDRLQNELRSFDFSVMPLIDWNNITDTYTSESSEKECDAVAELMNAVAHGARMQFSSETSLTYNYNAGHALIDFFGYHPDMHYYERALISDEEWIAIITAELKAGRPVLYEGANASIGHAFVCDGYDGKGYFHINWGWNGLSDGYYSLSLLNPKNQSTGGSDNGYSLRQTILCNIAPKETTGLLPQEKGLLNIDKLYFRDSSNFHISADVEKVISPLSDAMLFFYSFNKGMKPFSGEICAAVVGGSDLSPISIVEVEDVGSQNYTTVRLPLADVSIPDGTYKVGFYYRTSASKEWHPISSSTNGAPSGCQLIFKEGEATMSAIYPQVEPKMTDTLRHSRLYAYSDAVVSFELANSGDSRLETYAGIALMNEKGSLLAAHTLPILCPPNDKVSVEIDMPLKGISAGDYLLMPFYSNISNPTAEDIRPLAPEPLSVSVECIVLIPADGSYLFIDSESPNLSLSATNLLSHDWAAPIKVEILTQDGTSLGILEETELTLGSSATGKIEFDCSSIAMAKGTYKACFYIADPTPILLAEIPLIARTDISSTSIVAAENLKISISDAINISSPDIIISCMLYDANGRLLTSSRPLASKAVISGDLLQKGIYILLIETESGTIMTKKLKL